MKTTTLLLLVLFAAVVAADSMQKWKDLYRTAELKKFTSNATKFSEMWSDCSESLYIVHANFIINSESLIVPLTYAANLLQVALTTQ